MTLLTLRLLGYPIVELGGEQVTIRERKALALLAYLGVTAARHDREALGTLLWPEYPSSKVSSNLRHALWTLRHAGLGLWLDAGRDTVALCPGYRLDVAGFQQEVDAGQLEVAVSRYRADFLAGLVLHDAPAFDNWAFAESERLRRTLAAALERLGQEQGAKGAYEPAIVYTRRWLELDPLHEPAHRQLMRLYAWAGQHSAAMRQCEECVRLLEAELGSSPEDETLALCEAIRRRQVRAPALSADQAQPAGGGVDTLPALSPALRAHERPPVPQIPPEPVVSDLGRLVTVPAAGSMVCPVLVGRAAELAALRQAVDACRLGQGRVLILAGEAGIGKSRLAAEVVAYAAQHAVPALRGQCFPPDTQSPYAPIRDLLRADLARQPDRLDGIARDPALRELVALLPGIVPLPPDAPLPPVDPETRKQRIFAALTHYVLRKAPRAPALLLFEDLHWSDDTSLELIAHLARAGEEQPLLLLLTYRSDETAPPLQRLLVQLDRERRAQELTLGRLERADVGAMMRMLLALDRPVHLAFLDTIYPLTDGNPLLVEEVLRSLRALGPSAPDTDAWDLRASPRLPIPRTVQVAVQQRAESLSPAAHHMLALAAIVGRQFDIALLQDLARLDESSVLSALKELLAAQLVVEEDAAQFAFRHALVREAVYAGLLARERAALHRAVAETIERRSAEAGDAYLADLAYHYEAAGEWRPTLHYAQRAAALAAALYAPRAAAEQLTRAIRAADALGDARPELFHARGQAFERLGVFERAQADYEDALARVRAAGDGPLVWQVLVDLGLLWSGRDYARAGEYYRQALALARKRDDAAVLAQSLNRLGNWSVNSAQPLDGLRQHEEALAIFARLGDQRGLAETLDLMGMAGAQAGDTRRSEAWYAGAIERFRALDDRHGLASALTTVAFLGGIFFNDTVPASASGRQAAETAGKEALQIARDTDWHAGEAYALFVLSGLAGVRGAYASALELAHTSLAVAQGIGHRQWVAAAQLALAALYRDLLALPESRAHAERGLTEAHATGSRFWIAVATALYADVCRALGDLRASAAALDACQLTLPARSFAERQCWASRAELSLALGDAASALSIVAALPSSADSPDTTAPPRLDQVRGDALVAAGRFEEAEQALQAAAAGALEQGLRPLLWRVLVSLGALYRAEQRQDEAARALADARALVEELAAELPDRALRETFAHAALAAMPGARLKAPTSQPFGGLSLRERDVARRIAQGQSNRAIAEELVLSVRTVEDHVGRILAKLQLRSRAHVAAWATAIGLAEHIE